MELKKFSRLSMFLALSIVLSIIESMLPLLNGVMIPWLKLGLANIIVVFVLYTYGFKEAIYISILRVFLVGLLRTGLFNITFFFSLGGAFLSLIFMYIAKKLPFSVLGVSVIGSLGHSVGQIGMAILFLNTMNLLYYLPWVLLFSIPTGICIGILSSKLIEFYEKNL